MENAQQPVGDLEAKLRTILTRWFAGSELEADWSPSGARLSGLLSWVGFEGMSQLERQDKIWHVLEQELNPLERQRLSAVLTVTPLELEAMREEITLPS